MARRDGGPPHISRRPLPYAALLQHRKRESIDLVVIHCTELPDLATARAFGERVVYEGSGTGNSGHFYVDRDGAVEEWVPPERVAHHTRGYNERSIGIELVNRGRYPEWFDTRSQEMSEPYPMTQVESLVGLLQMLQRNLPALCWIASHESLDTDMIEATDTPGVLVRRKCDPGPLFPWDTVLSSVKLRQMQPTGQ